MRIPGAARVAALIALAAAGIAAHAAREPTAEPILRVETGMHTTLIRRVVVDAPRNRLITASDDKTVRVWQMPEARLVSVLRVPIDDGHEGQIFGIAVSPDGKTVAAGGWTGWDWEGTASIYFFDVDSGALVRRHARLENAVSALAWSPDGRHLAIGLQGRAGVKFLRLEDGATVTSDAQYLDKVLELDFGPTGRMVAVALDGMVRLYDKDFRLIGRRAVPGGKKPISVRHAPDGEKFAVAFVDAPIVSIASTRDLSLLHQTAAGQLPDQASIMTVAWSSDGRHLYGGGEYKGSGPNPIYRWPDAGRGVPERIAFLRNRITELQQMPGNRIAFAAEDPGVGVIGADGKVAAYRGPDIIDFHHSQILLSADGGVVSYPGSREGNRRHAFAALGEGEQVLSDEPKVPLNPPRLQAPGWAIQEWRDSYKLTVNGKAPKLDDYEMSRSYALAPDGNSLLLGTEWAVRLLNRDAGVLWSVKLPAVAWAVNVSRNGRLAVAALSDGTIRWFRMTDGREMLAYFPHGNGRDWIAWTPEGYYTSSVYGDNYVGWHLNRGKDTTPDFFRAVQFDRILYRPDVVGETFAAAQGPVTRALEPAAGVDFTIAGLQKIAPARLRVWAEAIEGVEANRPRALLRVEGERSALDMRDFVVFVNGIPVTPAAQRQLSGGEAQRFTRSLAVDLPAAANEIRVEAFNGVSMGVAETYIGLPPGVRPERVQGDLYVLAVGVNAFTNLPQGMHLAFAARDAEKLTQALQTRAAPFYRQVHTRVLTDRVADKPTRDSILSALEFVQQAQPEDTVVVFLASHGLSDKAGNYYFVPRDVTRKDVTGVRKGEAVETLIPWTTFYEALRSTAGRRILIVDTCHAKRIRGPFDAHSLMKRSAASLFPMIVAAQSKEQSQEYAPARQGLFTHALLTTLRASSDLDKDGVVSLKELFDQASPLVQKLSEKSVGPQNPQLVAPATLRNLPLMQGLSR